MPGATTTLLIGRPVQSPNGWRPSNSCGGSSLTLAPDFDEFCASLIDHRVEFVIVGAHALAFHGAPRFTGDLDVFVNPTEENARRLIAAISAFGFPTDAFTAADIVGGRKVIEMGIAPVQIHVMSHIDGVNWATVWDTHVVGPFGARQLPFIGREAFLRNKRASGRPKDLADIEALREQRD
jgi:hypothetical protein